MPTFNQLCNTYGHSLKNDYFNTEGLHMFSRRNLLKEDKVVICYVIDFPFYQGYRCFPVLQRLITPSDPTLFMMF